MENPFLLEIDGVSCYSYLFPYPVADASPSCSSRAHICCNRIGIRFFSTWACIVSNNSSICGPGRQDAVSLPRTQMAYHRQCHCCPCSWFLEKDVHRHVHVQRVFHRWVHLPCLIHFHFHFHSILVHEGEGDGAAWNGN